MKRVDLDKDGLHLVDKENDKEISLDIDKKKNVKLRFSICGDSFKDIFKKLFGGKHGKTK